MGILCGEGLYCSSSVPGSPGVCTKHAVTTAGEGEECNPSLPPASSILCGEGFYCSSSMPGGSGICTKCTPEACEPAQLNADPSVTTPTTSGMGERCNLSLSPP